MESDHDTSALHQALVDRLKEAGLIESPRIEEAFRAVPRHLFLPGVPPDQVYRDDAIVTKKQGERPVSSSSQPAVMAIMLEQLGLAPGHHVLEIGAGTGYNAALMAHLVGEAGKVTTVDLDEDIVEGAREHLAAAGFGRVEVICGDGGYGHPVSAPYDRMMVTAGTSEITPAWREQLQVGGRLVLPLAIMPGGGQQLVAFERSDDCLVSASIKNGGFMPLRGAFPGVHPSEGRRVELGPEPGLVLHLKENDPRVVDPAAIYQLLTGPSRDLPTGVQVTTHELAARYSKWSALSEPEPDYRGLGCGLGAQGELADRGLVPILFGLAGKFSSTGGLLKEGSLAVYARPTGHTLPPEWPKDEPPFELFVRSYGPDDSLAAYLIERLRHWDAAGRPPDEERWRIRAYPRETAYTASANEIMIERQFTRLVIAW